MWQAVRKFRKRNSGVAAVEFSLVVMPMMLLILATIETGLFYFNASVLESAVRDGARLIRTGQVHDLGDAETAFRDVMCPELVLISCGDIVLEVENYASFNDAINDPPNYDDDGNLIPKGFNPGTAEEVILARAAYRYNFTTPLVGGILSGSTTNSMLIQSVAIFRNEPYNFE